MDFYMKLPRGKRETALFMAIVSILSVNTIAPLISGFEIGFSLGMWAETLKVIPFIWLAAIALILLTRGPAKWLTSKIVHKEDSFNSCVTINIMCTVLLMSVFLTVIGTWIGSRHFSVEPIQMFFYKWPRNFTVAFAAEVLFAQPVARAAMYRLHLRKDRRNRMPDTDIA